MHVNGPQLVGAAQTLCLFARPLPELANRSSRDVGLPFSALDKSNLPDKAVIFREPLSVSIPFCPTPEVCLCVCVGVGGWAGGWGCLTQLLCAICCFTLTNGCAFGMHLLSSSLLIPPFSNSIFPSCQLKLVCGGQSTTQPDRWNQVFKPLSCQTTHS